MHSFLQNRNAVLEQERLTTTAELVTKREEVSFSTREIHRLQDALKELENKVATRDTDPVTSKDSLIQLEIERELRSKSEAREESERRERIAATAQLMAIQSELASKVGDVEERKNMQIESLKAEVLLMRQQRDAAIDESRRKDDKINMIEEEVKHLQRALEEAPKQGAVDVHEYVEKIAHLSGEIEGHKRSVLDLQRQLVRFIHVDNNAHIL